MTPSVLHICKVFLPVAGGVQKAVAQITSTVSNFSHTVLTTGEDGAINRQQLANAEVVRSRSYGQIASLPIAPSLIRRVISIARRHNLIAIHYPFPLAELAVLFLPFPPPIVVHWHSDIIAQKKLRWLVAPLTFLLLLRCKAIVVTSENMMPQSWFLRTFKKKVHFIPYGISAAPSVDKTSSTQAPYFLIIGRHVSYKGIEVAIKSMAAVEASLVIAGDGPLYEQHVELVKSLELGGKVRFIRYASDEDLNQLISDSLALVVPSVLENEAFALVQLEAMRQSKPVINTRLKSSVPWVARDQQEALTVEAVNATALSAAMTQLLEDPELATRLGKAGLERFNAEFSENKFQAQINRLYTSLLT